MYKDASRLINAHEVITRYFTEDIGYMPKRVVAEFEPDYWHRLVNSKKGWKWLSIHLNHTDAARLAPTGRSDIIDAAFDGHAHIES